MRHRWVPVLILVLLISALPLLAGTDAKTSAPTPAAPVCKATSSEPIDWRLHPNNFRNGAFSNQPEKSMVDIPPCPQLGICPALICLSGGRCGRSGLQSDLNLGITQCLLSGSVVYGCSGGQQIHKLTYACACPDGSGCRGNEIILACE